MGVGVPGKLPIPCRSPQSPLYPISCFYITTVCSVYVVRNLGATPDRRLLFEQPKLVAGLGSVWLLSSLFTVTVGQMPLFGSLLDLLLITPLTFAAMVGMAAVALDDRATFGDLTDNAGAYWKSLAGAIGLVALGGIVVGSILTIGAAALLL